MKKQLLFLLAVAAVAAIACLITLRLTHRRVTADEVTSHTWLHNELGLTQAQLKALEPIELQFGDRQRRHAEALRDAKHRLATVMAEDKAFTPGVAAAVENVHRAMGELQKVSIEHVFAMRSVLTAEQGDRLLKLAQESLESH